MLTFLESLLETLEELSASPWFYFAIFAIALLDSVIPVVPSETTVILGGAAAGSGELSILAVVALGALGALIGDSTAYVLGRSLERPVKRLLFRGPKGAGRLANLSEQIARRGGFLLITARFIPGGRTALTVTCGVTKQPYAAWFLRWDLLAVVIWASYAGGLGYFFGQRFDHGTAFMYAFGTALTVTVIIEIVQRLRHRSSD